MAVDLTGYPSKDCAIFSPPNYVIDPQVHLCAGIRESRGTLNGDSGGKIYLKDLKFFSLDGIWVFLHFFKTSTSLPDLDHVVFHLIYFNI